MFKDLNSKIRFLLAWAGVLMVIVKIIEYALSQFEGVVFPEWKSKNAVIENLNEVEKVNTELKSDVSKIDQNVK